MVSCAQAGGLLEVHCDIVPRSIDESIGEMLQLYLTQDFIDSFLLTHWLVSQLAFHCGAGVWCRWISVSSPIWKWRSTVSLNWWSQRLCWHQKRLCMFDGAILFIFLTVATWRRSCPLGLWIDGNHATSFRSCTNHWQKVAVEDTDETWSWLISTVALSSFSKIANDHSISHGPPSQVWLVLTTD